MNPLPKQLWRNCSLLSALLCFLSVNAQHHQFVTNGLVAFYPLDGNGTNAVDSHGVGNLELVNVEFATDRFGHGNSAGSFNGTNSIARSAVNDVLSNSREVTVSLWAFLQDSRSGTLFNRWQSSSNSFWDDLSIFTQYPNPATNLIVVDWNGEGGNPDSSISYFGNGLSLKSWSHVVLSVSSSNAVFYVNGEVNWTTRNTLAPLNRLFSQSAAWGFGAQADSSGPGTVLNGRIDDARIYSRTLNPSEVRALYEFEAGSIRRATASAVVANEFVVDVMVTDGGFGFTEPPLVEIRGNGSGATAVATVEGGRVTRIKVTDAGIGYTGEVTVRIAPPPKLPTLSVAVRTVRLTFNVWQGFRYIVESSFDLATWEPRLDFVAEGDSITRDLEVPDSGLFFRISEVP